MPEAFITHSCTAALERAAILAGLEPGDEVIMPSFTFVSTANAVVLRRGVPVSVDVRADTLNLDERLVEEAITARTRAIYVVHYAGVPAEMDPIREVARRHGLVVVEDAAQALLSTYRGRPAGQLGDLACFSFHETKNATAGEAGALAVNDPDPAERAFVIWEEGTDRRAFKLGQVDKYTWLDIGWSFLPSEFTAAILLAQLDEAAFFGLEATECVRRPVVRDHFTHNGHLYYLLLASGEERDSPIRRPQRKTWARSAVMHNVPLNTITAGRSARLVRRGAT